MTRPGPDVTLIRHGETTWSANGQHTGRTDLELTPAGEAQARSLGVLLAERRFDLVLASPLRRARHTAELAGLGVDAVTDDLREWDYGDLEGLTTEQIRAERPDWTIWDGPWSGGESAADVAARVDRLIARVTGEAAGARVALVAHGHILRVVAVRWLGAEAAAGRDLALGTASVSELGWEHGRHVIVRWNLTPGPLPA